MLWLLTISTLVLAIGVEQEPEKSADPQQSADLLVTNARVIDGSGRVIAKGSILIREGRIESVVKGDAPETAKRIIDAGGKTVMPGLIDTHRHFLPYSGAASEAELATYIETQLPLVLEGLLTAGLTTVMSPGDFVPEIFEIRRRSSQGALVGPRLVTAGPVFTAPGGHPAEGPVCSGDPFCRGRVAVEVDDAKLARDEVKQAVGTGATAIKVVIDQTLVPNTVIHDAVVEAIASESDALGVPLIVHAESVVDMLKAVELGADKLVHTPLSGSVKESGAAAILAQRGIPIATTVAFATREAASAGGWPWNEAAYNLQLENIRHLVDGGVVVAFGTDNPPFLGLTEFMYEVKALGTVLTPREVIECLTIQAARFLGMDDELGTLEPGKLADLIIVDGDPLEDLTALGRVVVVVKQGRVVADKR